MSSGQFEKSHHLVVLIDTYPGVNGDVCLGGAETNLERLIRFVSDHYGQDYKCTIFIRRGTIEASALRLNPQAALPKIIKIKSLNEFTNFLIERQDEIDIFYCADKTLYFRFHLFIRMLRKFKKPILLRITSSKYLDSLRLIPEWMRSLFVKFFLHQRSNIFVIALSQNCYEGLMALGVRKDRIVSLPNSVDLSKYKPPESMKQKKELRLKLFPKMPDTACLFIYVGRIIGWHKRVDFLLEAWQKSHLSAQGHRLLLVGSPKSDFFIKDGFKIWKSSGPQNGSSGEGKVPGTFWTGFVSMEDLPSYLWMSDVFVLPSDFEGMSNAAIEALAAGLPILGRKGVSGNEELIDTKRTGLLFENQKEIVEQLIWMAKSENRKGMEEAALQKGQNFSVEAMCDRYIQLFQRMHR